MRQASGIVASLALAALAGCGAFMPSLQAAAPEPITPPVPHTPGAASSVDDRFRHATALVQAGDTGGAARIYRNLASEGQESASLYWNWAQGAQGRGAPGEALWALLRARELGPADRAVAREIDRIRELCGLDPAELSPQPLAALGRFSRRLHLDLLAVTLLVVSLVLHALARWRRTSRWPVPAAWSVAALAFLAAVPPLAASAAKPTAVVVRRGVPLADAASPTAGTITTLREGEVVPVLGVSASHLRIQDSSGARGWVLAADVWRLDLPPSAE